ncbi:hypothetical protein N7532_007225 [Penicillium argentinense]|uniref:Uncharacterized protein n=1 Tax=Penicillium argentinense TaxID=1131581 RepID=A0A9W9K6J7_9EURO|nr:uncharacterized protein N7532_007225 [Penicillium argentinense]KAJ5094934.1 hypothetical protein N7532_007225 [Penicillium argentinense]
MGLQRLSWLALGLLSALHVDVSSAVALKPLDLVQHTSQKVSRDNDYSKLDLLSSETFLWGGSTGNSRYALGNFTTFYPGKHENIISLEKIFPMLKSTECTPHSLTMNFDDDQAYRYGAKAWQWVNDEKNRTFVLVAGQGHCNWNEDRLPFVITDVEFDGASNTIKAIGHASDWKKVSHSYELFVGGRPASNKRDYDDSYSFDVNHNLPLSHVQVGDGDIKLSYDCYGCGIKGEFEFAFHISTWMGIPKDVELVLSPHGVEAVFEPRVGIVANLPGKISKEYPLGTIPIDGISIAGGILDLGPELEFGWGFSAGPLKGSAGITTGGTLSLSDSASMTIDLLDPDVSQNGWEPKFTPKEFTVDAALRGSVELDLFAKIQLALEALDHGFDVGVKLQPFGGATVSLAANSGDACVGQEGKHEAVKLLPSVGAALIGEAAVKDGTESPFLSATLASYVYTLPTFCTAFNAGPSLPTESFSSAPLYSIPTYSKPSPHYLTSAPPSSSRAVTRTHKVNDREYQAEGGIMPPHDNLPRFFGRSGPTDADPKKTKKRWWRQG